jgi:hypothetical protein
LEITWRIKIMELNSNGVNKVTKAQIKSKIHKVCVNRFPVYDSDGRVQLYRRPDLSEWAAKAAADGERYFYIEAINPNINGGKLRLCCPKYEYRVDSLMQEEYNALKELLNGDD